MCSPVFAIPIMATRAATHLVRSSTKYPPGIQDKQDGYD